MSTTPTTEMPRRSLTARKRTSAEMRTGGVSRRPSSIREASMKAPPSVKAPGFFSVHDHVIHPWTIEAGVHATFGSLRGLLGATVMGLSIYFGVLVDGSMTTPEFKGAEGVAVYLIVVSTILGCVSGLAAMASSVMSLRTLWVQRDGDNGEAFKWDVRTSRLTSMFSWFSSGMLVGPVLALNGDPTRSAKDACPECTGVAWALAGCTFALWFCSSYLAFRGLSKSLWSYGVQAAPKIIFGGFASAIGADFGIKLDYLIRNDEFTALESELQHQFSRFFTFQLFNAFAAVAFSLLGGVISLMSLWARSRFYLFLDILWTFMIFWVQLCPAAAFFWAMEMRIVLSDLENFGHSPAPDISRLVAETEVEAICLFVATLIIVTLHATAFCHASLAQFFEFAMPWEWRVIPEIECPLVGTMEGGDSPVGRRSGATKYGMSDDLAMGS